MPTGEGSGWTGAWPAPAALADRIRNVHRLTVSPEAARTLLTYLDLLERWAARFNLVSARSREEVVDRHLVDSFGVAAVVEGRTRIADVGSGAGFPGVPLAITRLDSEILLIEPRRHRANFLREVTRRLALTNARVAECRADAEELAGEIFDVVTGRAVRIDDLVVVAETLLASAGRLVLMRKADGELLAPAGYERDRTHAYELADGSLHETIAFVRKCST